jgi:FkbM family methyltransferase
MLTLKHKFAVAKHLYKTQGIQGVQARIAWHISQWLWRDRWITGKLVELRGNIVTFDGCHFKVDNPAISTATKTGFVSGHYENDERHILKKHLDPQLPVVEFGGGIGVVACLTNKRLTHPQQHVVVEANPTLKPLIEENRQRNGSQFTVLSRALGYGSEAITFYLHDKFVKNSAHHSSQTAIEVPTISFRQVVDQFGFDCCTLICDVEGTEVELVEHEAEVLASRVKTFIVEIHPQIVGKEPTDAAIKQLESLGFSFVYRSRRNFVYSNSRFKTG